MEIISSDQKDYLGRSGKKLITSLGINTNERSNTNKNTRYAITHVIMKDLSNIIKDFEKLPYKGYVQNSTKHEPTDSYFYIAIHLAKCMIKANDFNSYVDPVRVKITGKQHIQISHVCDSDEIKSKGIIVVKNILQVCSMNERES